MKIVKLLATLLVFGVAGNASAIEFKFSGDLNHRFNLHTNQAGFYSVSESIAASPSAANPVAGEVVEDGVGETWGEIKYRLQVEAATEDKLVRGVYAIELGAIRFGDTTRGGGYSGDGNNYETRFAYVDFGLPRLRMTVGLMPFIANKYLWSETAMGVQAKGALGPVALTAAWVRGVEAFNTRPGHQQFRDNDNLLLRGDVSPSKDLKVGVFGLYQRARPEGGAVVASHLLKNVRGVDYDLYNVGVDGAVKAGPAFVNFDAIYQGGNSGALGAAEVDHSAFFAHADVGVDVGAVRVTYTGWYSSGDDDATDGDVNNYIATDVDAFDSIVLFEGGYTDDVYFTEAPYFLTFGAIFNKVAVDFKLGDKTTLSGAAMYIMTAEDIALPAAAGGGAENVIGTEFDAAIAYKLNKNMELAVNGGYLISGDAMRFWGADENIFRTTARARYTF